MTAKPVFSGFFCLAAVVCVSCRRPSTTIEDPGRTAASALAERTAVSAANTREAAVFVDRLRLAAALAGLDEKAISPVLEAAADPAFRSRFISDAAAALAGDPYLILPVDKQRALPADYAPSDLEALTGGTYQMSKEGLRLRSAARAALELMAASALADGVALTVSSAYRSYDYQNTVYGRVVAELGEAAADRESARPGHSQHQLGLAADFGSITDAFADTAESRWLVANAESFGWSLSYPEGYEDLTGYRWESWHYRYLGMPAASFVRRYFGGVQHYGLLFLSAWEE